MKTETVFPPGQGALSERDIDPLLDLDAEIGRLKREKNAVILAHYYQEGEIQDIADFVGDSLDLSRKAAQTDADMIVFCGVRFMAEVANILSPDKKVVLPDAAAGCSLEDSCQPEAYAAFRAQHPDHIAVNYINSSAEVKAMSDYIVTSSNAEHIINSLPKDKPIIFGPDRHLGAYLNRKTGRDMVLWPGTCIVHEQFSAREITRLKDSHPGALVAAHPECPEGILEVSDHIGSTRSILDFVTSNKANEFIVATEQNIIHQMQKSAPEKTFYPAPGADGSCNCAQCPFMELNTMEKLYLCMVNEAPFVRLPEDLRVRALKPLERMLELSPPPAKKSVAAAE
ncbi:MAG: quinolinate synthase NadA [Rhodospirillaceae bacterium]|nr:quinolinate synthase NadA [Rhodospirillaceae bacterium]